MFPISLEGSIDIPEISLRQTNDVMARLVSALERERASEVVCDGNTVRFCGGIRPGAIFSSWNVLNTVSRGTISVSSGSNALVKYRLSFRDVHVLNAHSYRRLAGHPGRQTRALSVRCATVAVVLGVRHELRCCVAPSPRVYTEGCCCLTARGRRAG